MNDSIRSNIVVEPKREDDGKRGKYSMFDSVLVLTKVILSTWLGLCLGFFFLIYRYSGWIQRNILFSHFARWPLSTDFEDTLKCGIAGTRNFYLTTHDNVRLGVWHILPRYLCEKATSVQTSEEKEELFSELLRNAGEPVMLYMHGNSGTRATFHRIEMYKLLQKLNLHVVTFDYRSYGDSSDILPDEVGVVEDAKTVLRWVYEKKSSSPFYVWGHSLGTAIAAHALADLKGENIKLDGVILEAPFNNLKDEIRSHPLATFLKYMIGFDYVLVEPMIKNGNSFKTDEYLSTLSANTLILHAQDDWIVPAQLGRKLYRYLLEHRTKDVALKFVEFSSVNRYGHKYLCHSDNLPKIIKLFVTGEIDSIEPCYT